MEICARNNATAAEAEDLVKLLRIADRHIELGYYGAISDKRGYNGGKGFKYYVPNLLPIMFEDSDDGTWGGKTSTSSSLKVA